MWKINILLKIHIITRLGQADTQRECGLDLLVCIQPDSKALQVENLNILKGKRSELDHAVLPNC